MNTRHPGRTPKTSWPNCKVEGCQRNTKNGSKAMCATHYMASRRGALDVETGKRLREPLRVPSYGPGARCLIDGCFSRPKANGLCSGHWQREKNGLVLFSPIGPPRGLSPNTLLCVVVGCDRRANNRGMCQAHAEQRHRGILDENGNKLRDHMKGGRPRTKEQWETSGGYVLVQAPLSHPFARQDGSILKHRLVMESRIGRYLEEWEIVHHKNGQRSDNRIENLELLDGRAKKGEGHPPGHSYDVATAAQVLIQDSRVPEYVRTFLRQMNSKE